MSFYDEPTEAKITKNQIIRLIRTYAVELTDKNLSNDDVRALCDKIASLRRHLDQ